MTSRFKFRFHLLTFLKYACGLLLLWEWLHPLKILDDTNNISVFLGFLVLSLILSFLDVHLVISSILRLIYVLYSLHFLYFEGSFFQFIWIPLFVEEIQKNIAFIFEQEWVNFSNLFKSVLFYFLLYLITYLIRYWLTNRKQIFLFFFMTLVYITILDTFTQYEADAAIVRAVIAGFGLMGILAFERVIEKENLPRETTLSKKWIISLIFMMGFSVLMGFVSPKLEPIWPDPVPYIKSYAEGSGSDVGGASKVGYGTDDSQLGGPFIGDDTLVYVTETDSRHYWKVEVKDFYTGKGWETSAPQPELFSFSQDEAVPFSVLYNQNIEVTERTGVVRPIVDWYPHIIYPLNVKKVSGDIDYYFEADLALEKIYSKEASVLSPIGEYSVEYHSPKYSVATLMEGSNKNHSVLNSGLLEHYTQLPKELPPRVRDLAFELTKDKTNWFDKAKAIESYFDQPQFIYDQSKVAVPGEKDDYVDQFLFETMRGYCDNFSTSMVVLLRSVDIPARWVKGYTEGEYRGVAESGQRLYEITNNNAHSWVEVFFPEVGWVPFEPTKGFSNNVQFTYDNLTATQNETQRPEVEEELEADASEEEKVENQTTASSTSFDKFWNAFTEFFTKHGEWLVGLVVIIVCGIGILYKNRLKWLPYYWLYRYKSRVREEDFPLAYITLLKQLERCGLKREENQTLREYAVYVDECFSTEDMGQLTLKYEQYLYRGRLENDSWRDTKQLWENLIKKTIA